MSICAPTLLLISTGPLSATPCPPCSMMAISCWQATSLGKVATAPPTTTTCPLPFPLPYRKKSPPFPCCVCFVCFGAEGRRIQTFLCVSLTSWHQLDCVCTEHVMTTVRLLSKHILSFALSLGMCSSKTICPSLTHAVNATSVFVTPPLHPITQSPRILRHLGMFWSF